MGATIDEIIDSLKRGQGKRVSDLVKMALEEGKDPQMILADGFLAAILADSLSANSKKVQFSLYVFAVAPRKGCVD